MGDVLERIFHMTALDSLIDQPQFLIMYALAFLLLYLGIKKEFEPLLLVPIAFGVLIANFPGGNMGVLAAVDQVVNGVTYHNAITLADGTIWADANGIPYNIYEVGLPQIAHDLGIMNFLYYALIKSGLLPPIIFMGVGALTDFGPMLRNLKLAIFGAGA